MAEPLIKKPPQNIEAEQSLLGCLMLDKNAIVKVSDFVSAEDFYKNTHKEIFSVMADLFEKSEPIDIISVSAKLKEKGQLDGIGGSTYLTSLINLVPTATHVANYAKIVREKKVLRDLITASEEIGLNAFDESQEVDELLDKAEKSIFSIGQKTLTQAFIPIKDLIPQVYEGIEQRSQHTGLYRGIPTGFNQLDNLLAGLQKSNLLILAARPSMGKTSLALDMARKIAVEQKIPVGIFSLEMSKEELVDRMLCAEADVDMWKMRTGKLSDREDFSGESDFSKIGHAMGKLAEAKIFIDDSPTANVMEIRTKARRLQAEHGIGFIVLDYLQLMDSASASYSDNRVQVVSEISRGLKAVARELDIPLLAISQLSRQVENRPTAIPKLADLRESGSIEQDADVVLFIYREEMYKRDTVRPHIADIYIAKHRNGPTGVMELFFDETKASFKNLEKKIEGQMPPEST